MPDDTHPLKHAKDDALESLTQDRDELMEAVEKLHKAAVAVSNHDRRRGYRRTQGHWSRLHDAIRKYRAALARTEDSGPGKYLPKELIALAGNVDSLTQERDALREALVAIGLHAAEGKAKASDAFTRIVAISDLVNAALSKEGNRNGEKEGEG